MLALRPQRTKGVIGLGINGAKNEDWRPQNRSEDLNKPENVGSCDFV